MEQCRSTAGFLADIYCRVISTTVLRHTEGVNHECGTTGLEDPIVEEVRHILSRSGCKCIAQLFAANGAEGVVRKYGPKARAEEAVTKVTA